MDISLMLQDVAPPELAAQPIETNIHYSPNLINIGFKGYGEKTMAEGYGCPIMIELYQGKLRLLVWADINQEDPTHIINLDGAQESKRKE